MPPQHALSCRAWSGHPATAAKGPARDQCGTWQDPVPDRTSACLAPDRSAGGCRSLRPPDPRSQKRGCPEFRWTSVAVPG